MKWIYGGGSALLRESPPTASTVFQKFPLTVGGTFSSGSISVVSFRTRRVVKKWFIPGGDRHVSSGDPKEGALFYEESPGKFDLNPVPAK